MKESNIGMCEFCGKEKELGDSTPFHGFYCMECMKMNIEYDRESIKKMKPIKNTGKRKVLTEKELHEIEKAKNDALAKLMNM